VGSQTQVVNTGNTFIITGGRAAGDGQALFHSFEQFGLTSGQIATFFSQPEVQTILGRVVGGEASYINGLLQVTGGTADLYLINPAGILFGSQAQLDLSGTFAATTASGIPFEQGIFSAIAPNDYEAISGQPVGFVFSQADAGAIVNAGQLTVAPGATLMLVGGQVISTGTLSAPGGDITIAAVPGANLVRISRADLALSLELETVPEALIQGGQPLTPLTLPALLTGSSGDVATGLSVQPDGTVALVNDGTILSAVSGLAIAAGSLDSTGTVGGNVTVVGDRVGLLGATVNASGRTGGGTVRVGGDYQGQDTLPGATLTYVSEDTTMTADAGLSGDGGQVILWADDATAFYGNISAAGGALAGDGGFVEVSGAQTLIYRGTVSAAAPAGQIGTLLLDPTDITIRNGSGDGDDSDGSPLQLTEFNIAATDPLPTILFESELESSPGNLDLVIRASNNILLEDLADNELRFNSDPVAPGSITLAAGNEVRFQDLSDALVAPRRSLTIMANTITTGTLDTASPADGGGDITLNATGAIVVGDLLAEGDAVGDGGGDIAITGASIQAGQIDSGGGFLNDSQVELTATSGDVIVATIAAGGGGLEVNAARRFQARSTFDFDTFVRLTLDSSTDAELIDFLMRGDPQPLIDAGLVDTTDQVFIYIPTSILVNPGGGQPGNILIRHGGQTVTLSSPNITIEGSGADPTIQFVAGPNDDHTITIDAAIPFAEFDNFTPLFVTPEDFPAAASGATGAILRGQGDATLVTSFQNQPFVPIVDNPGIETPVIETPPNPGDNPGSLPGGEDPGLIDTTGLQNLAAETADVGGGSGEEEPSELVDEVPVEACTLAMVNRTGGTVAIRNTCDASDAETGSDAAP
jgi:filamentous hemagglutinin family protein